jgi:hypothetical protein
VAPPAAVGPPKKRAFGPPWFVTVITGHRTRTYRADTNELVETNLAEFVREPGGEPGVIDGVRDPRTFLLAARTGKAPVIRLPPATIRGISVVRFQVGRCRWVMGRVPEYVHDRSGHRRRVTKPWPHVLSSPMVFSVSRRGYLPVRVEWPSCGPSGWALPRRGVDYPTFRVLPANAANRRLLEMSAHPGARVVHGH